MLLEPTVKENLIKSFSEVAAYSQKIDIHRLQQIPYLIEDWFEAKSKLSDDYLDGRLIKEFGKVSIGLTAEEKKKKVERFIADLEDDTYLLEKINYYSIIDIQKFLSSNIDSFYENVCLKDYITENVTIKNGSKISKALKYFVDDHDALRYLQDSISELIQQTKLTGTLCLSVHPLDYLSISENAYNWRSCHALDGGHRAGNISYMLDQCTCVCYIKGDEDTKLPHFPKSVPWNNKKWRVLLYLSPNRELIFAGRQYPLTSTEALNLIRNIFNKDYRYSCWEQAFDHIRQPNDGAGEIIPFNEPHIRINDSIFRISEIVHDLKGSWQYNDLLYSTVYTPYYLFSFDSILDVGDKSIYKSYSPRSFDNGLLIEVGGDTRCLCCGDPVFDESDFLCLNCEKEFGTRTDGFMRCSCCGHKEWIEDLDTIEGLDSWANDFLCPECVKTKTEQCPKCHRRYYIEDNQLILAADGTDDPVGCVCCQNEDNLFDFVF